MDLARAFDLLDSFGEEGGFSVRPTTSSVVRVETKTSSRTAQTRALDVPPNPARVTRDLAAVGDDGALLYVVPHITKSLRWAALSDPRVILVAVAEHAVILDGFEWREVSPEVPPSAPRGRRPWGRFGVARALLRSDVPRSQAQFAAEVGITQQAVALSLKALSPLGVGRVSGGWVAHDASRLWSAFLSDYPGPGGIRRQWSGAADLRTQVERVREIASAEQAELLVSGDVAADELAPWRRPVTAAVYASTDLDLSARSVVSRGDDWAISVVVPEDRTIFATALAWHAGREPTASHTFTDPLITAWEVTQSRGPDRSDAVHELERVVLAERRQQ